MLDLVGRVLLLLRGGSLRLLTTAGLVLLTWGIFAPVGTLVWWANQGADVGLKSLSRPRRDSPELGQITIDCYIVFLAGVGDFSADQLTSGENFFFQNLLKDHPNCVAVTNVFAYSVANEGLDGKRFSAPLWRFAQNAKGWMSPANLLVKIRNLWRFAISEDDRYGLAYNQGIATSIMGRMNEANALPAHPDPQLQVILIGTSGGAQVALGAVPYLKEWLGARVDVVSIGGVFAGENGFEAADQVYHLQGDRDWVEDTGNVFPSRWPWVIASPFNQARREGRYHAYHIGPQEHDGSRGYFGEATVEGMLGDKTYVELTLQAVNQLPVWSKQP